MSDDRLQLLVKYRVYDYNLKSAHYHAEQRFKLSKIGKPPAFVDGQIASIAFIKYLTLVTNNVKDFEDLMG
jgi:tRNA(fMet)-specific endonuclease VapC